MAEPKKKHETLLLPEVEQNKPIKNIWIWLLLLAIGMALTFWRDAIFDKNTERQQIEEQVNKINREIKAAAQVSEVSEKSEKSSKSRN